MAIEEIRANVTFSIDGVPMKKVIRVTRTSRVVESGDENEAIMSELMWLIKNAKRDALLDRHGHTVKTA